MTSILLKYFRQNGAPFRFENPGGDAKHFLQYKKTTKRSKYLDQNCLP
ncbi:hypothetical protein LEP1GSC137_3637 [Leptospira borgpetersenii str. Noumea 25]|nr:hypothetical protein LEP1GSC137_3637 [Leptospira borgpetersenii str. Noumea 25]